MKNYANKKKHKNVCRKPSQAKNVIYFNFWAVLLSCVGGGVVYTETNHPKHNQNSRMDVSLLLSFTHVPSKDVQGL